MRLPGPLTAPWAISHDGMRLVLNVASRDTLFQDARELALAAREGKPLDNARAVTVRDGVAVIPITGPLFRHASMLTEVSGATSYADIRRDLQTALENPTVKAILLDVNSPGGEVDGANELSDAVFRARGQKKIVAYAGGACASAAYWVASAAEKVVAAKTSQLGSIGAVTVLVDDSEREAKAGVRAVEIVSSQSPSKRTRPVDDDVTARMQARVDEMADVLIETVARNRAVSVEKVLADFGQGDVLIGKQAVAAGLADEIGDFEEVLRELSTGQAISPAHRGEPMSLKNKAEEPKPEDKAEDMPEKAMPEDEKPEEKAMPEDEACEACGGKGEMPDGSKCAACGGSGKASKSKAEDEPMPKSEGDKDEDKAMARLRAKLGLPVSASARDIERMIDAKYVGADQLAAMQAQLATLAAREVERANREITGAAARFADEAIGKHRQVASKRDLLIEAYRDAEMAKAGTGATAAGRHLFPENTFAALKVHTSNGAPMGAEPSSPQGDGVGAGLVAAARGLMKKDPSLNMDRAMDIAYQQNPGLYER